MIAIGLLCFTLGMVVIGTAWAWYDTRRRQRDLGARQTEIDARHQALELEHAQQGKALLLLDSKHRALDVLVYDARQDIGNLCEATNVQRYTRGSKAG